MTRQTITSTSIPSNGHLPRHYAIGERVMLKFAEEMEAQYRRERSEAAQRLHNALAEIIGAQQASVETILYVLELVRWEVMSQQAQALFEPAKEAVIGLHEDPANG